MSRVQHNERKATSVILAQVQYKKLISDAFKCLKLTTSYSLRKAENELKVFLYHSNVHDVKKIGISPQQDKINAYYN